MFFGMFFIVKFFEMNGILKFVFVFVVLVIVFVVVFGGLIVVFKYFGLVDNDVILEILKNFCEKFYNFYLNLEDFYRIVLNYIWESERNIILCEVF